MYIVVQDPSLVTCAYHECFGLILCANCQFLVIDTFEAALNHCISLPICLKYTLVQLGVFHSHFLTIDCHITKNSLCCIFYYVLLILKTVHLVSECYKLGDTMDAVFILQNRSQQLHLEIEE